MNGQEIKILFNEDKAYLTSGRAMSFEQFDIPKEIKEFVRSYWIVKILSYTESEIFCQVLTYHLGATEFDENQKSFVDKLNKIQKVRFRNINTIGMYKCLPRTANGAIRPLTYKPQKEVVYNPEPYVKKPFKQNIRETFDVPLKNVQFNQGGVSFSKKFYEHRETIDLTITNSDIKEEYDAIKNYFGNVLKTKKIKVTVNIEIIDHVITSIEVKSPEIDRIDKSLIDNVKIEFVKSNIKKQSNQENGKTLFTIDEYFENLTEGNSNSTLFYSNEKDFLEDLIAISNSKHYYQLRYLSSKHAHSIIKLRFAQKPLSFIFLVNALNKYHFIWETIDTEEATYIWSVEKSISQVKSTLQHIDNAIKLIKEHGKMAYLITTKEKPNRIFHDYSDSKKGFNKWKDDLNFALT